MQVYIDPLLRVITPIPVNLLTIFRQSNVMASVFGSSLSFAALLIAGAVC